MKYRKLTHKEQDDAFKNINQNIYLLHQQIEQLKSYIMNINTVMQEYINFKKDKSKFIKHLEKEKAKNEKTSNTKHEKLQKKDEDNK